MSRIPECTALAKGLHPRLGVASPFFRLDPGLVRYIADLYNKVETHYVECETLVPHFPVDDQMCLYTNPPTGETHCRFVITVDGFSVEGVVSPDPGFVYFFGPSVGGNRLRVKLTPSYKEVSIQTGRWYTPHDRQILKLRYLSFYYQSLGPHVTHVLHPPFNGSVELLWP